MGFVDGEQCDPGLFQQILHARHDQPLGSDIEQVERAFAAASVRPPRFAASSVELRKAARTPSCRSAATWSCISAISGENHQRRAFAQQCRQLVAQ